MGVTPIGPIAAYAGRHTLKLENSQLALVKTLPVTVRANETVKLDLTLTPAD